MSKHHLITFGFIFAMLGSAAAQTWSASGQIRQRFEINGKDFNSDTKMSSFNLLRSRLNVAFQPSDDVTGFIQFQDSRTFGEETGTLGDGNADNLDLHQGYVAIANLFGKPVDLKLGRMEVNFGPQRLVGAVGWHNIGRSFDGAIFKVHAGEHSIDLFNLKEDEVYPQGDSLDKEVLGVYADLAISPRYTIQPFLIWQRQPGLDRKTLGFYVHGKLGAFHHETEGAYQLGSQGANDISAFMVGLNIGYTLSDLPMSPDITVGVDYLSGDDDLSDETNKVFNTLYATNHKYYGFMDYFLDIPAHTYGAGLTDMHAKVSIQPLERTKLNAALHIFRASQAVTRPYSVASQDFFKEVDLTLIHTYNSKVSFVAGASVALPGELYKDCPCNSYGSDAATWAYLMTVVNF